MKILRWALLILVAATLPAFGQATTPAPAGDSKLERTTVQDWVLECLNPPVSGTNCQVMYTVLFGPNRTPVFVTALVSPGGGKPARVTFALPLNINLKAGLVISGASKTVTYQFDRCTNEGCLVEQVVSADLYAILTGSQSGFATVVRDGGEQFRIPFSFKGFVDAVKLMNARNNIKAQ